MSMNDRSASVAATVGSLFLAIFPYHTPSGSTQTKLPILCTTNPSRSHYADTSITRERTASPGGMGMSIDPVGTGSGQSSALMTPVADPSEQGGNNPNYPASFARRLPAGQVGTTSGDPMSQKKVKEIQNWRQSQVIPEDLQGALGGSNQDDEEEDELEEDEEETELQTKEVPYPSALPSSRLGSEAPPSPLRLLQRRNQIYPHASSVSPNGSMLVLPYGQSRSNSVESFSSFPSAVDQPEYDSDQSMLDDQRS